MHYLHSNLDYCINPPPSLSGFHSFFGFFFLETSYFVVNLSFSLQSFMYLRPRTIVGKHMKSMHAMGNTKMTRVFVALIVRVPVALCSRGGES